jgi:nucleoside-diphosphate-sugar epimerase
MRVFVAGATGAVGAHLVPMLVSAGHEVTAMTRSPAKAPGLRRLGAEPAVADGLDRAAVTAAVARARPEVVVHQMTSLGGMTSMRRFHEQLAQTNRLRTQGTEILLEAAEAAGARRLVAQSYGCWAYGGVARRLKTEDDPFDASPPASMGATLRAIRRLESDVAGAGRLEGVALRYGFFYGPGTGFGPDGGITELVRRRELPIIGGGEGVWSFIHVHDAAAAAGAAVERGAPGVYNIVDDDPAQAAEWIPALARMLGAKPPRHVPAWIGRLAAGEAGVYLFTRTDGRSNAKARRQLRWSPVYASWRDGFGVDLKAASARAATRAA